MASESDDAESDQVGYRKPPRHSQFKKGQSGNPGGRKARSRNTSTLLREELETIIDVREGGRTRKLTKRQALVKTLVNDAIAGKNHARQLLIRILEVETPPEPFEASDDDHQLLREFLDSQDR